VKPNRQKEIKRTRKQVLENKLERAEAK